LDGIEVRLYEIEGRRYRVPPRFNEVLDRVDELALRFEGTENRLEQLCGADPRSRYARQRRGRGPQPYQPLMGLLRRPCPRGNIDAANR
jgi:hypothetical protein